MNEHQPTPTAHLDLIDLLLHDGLGQGFPKFADLPLNAAMPMERATHINAGPYERVEARNGFKPHSFHTSMGGLNRVRPRAFTFTDYSVV